MEAEPARSPTVAVSVRVYVAPGCSKPGNKTRLLFRIPVVLNKDMSRLLSSMLHRYSTGLEFGIAPPPSMSEPPNKASFFEGFCLRSFNGSIKTSGNLPGRTLIWTLDSTASPSSLLTTSEKWYTNRLDKLPAPIFHSHTSNEGAVNGQRPNGARLEARTAVHVQLYVSTASGSSGSPNASPHASTSNGLSSPTFLFPPTMDPESGSSANVTCTVALPHTAVPRMHPTQTTSYTTFLLRYEPRSSRPRRRFEPLEASNRSSSGITTPSESVASTLRQVYSIWAFAPSKQDASFADACRTTELSALTRTVGGAAMLIVGMGAAALLTTTSNGGLSLPRKLRTTRANTKAEPPSSSARSAILSIPEPCVGIKAASRAD
mmetsp:Transcript_30352/g.83080  ORF Transcript_30352/g.83080 Transcript_30352/m.83080 type:complete len:376 (-) Transcript_30352:3055-4182(-)